MATPRTEPHLRARAHSAVTRSLHRAVTRSPHRAVTRSLHRATIRSLPPTRRLRPAERMRLAGEIVAAYLRARRELRRAPIASVVAALRSESPPPLPPQPAGALEEARRLGRAVARTLRLMPGDTRCLARSLVLTRLLARRGIPAKLVIGARAAPKFLAHAWVECEGQPVLSPGDGSFGRLVEL